MATNQMNHELQLGGHLFNRDSTIALTHAKQCKELNLTREDLLAYHKNHQIVVSCDHWICIQQSPGEWRGWLEDQDRPSTGSKDRKKDYVEDYRT